MKQRLAYAGMGQRPMFAGGGGIPAEDVGKVKVSVEDSVEQFLNDKIIVDGNISKEIVQEIVGGCPIGKTFYEGGTLEYPFSVGDFTSNYGQIVDGDTVNLKTDSGGSSLRCDFGEKIRGGTNISYIEIVLRLGDADFSFKQAELRQVFNHNILVNTDSGLLQVGAQTVTGKDWDYTDRDLICTVIYENGVLTVDAICNGDRAVIVDETAVVGEGLFWNYYIVGGINSYQYIEYIKVVADGLEGECTGLIIEEKLKLSSTVSDFTTSFEFSNANQITVNTIIQCPSGEGNFGGANPNGTRSYFPGSSITGVKVDIRKYVTDGAGSITIQIRSRLADGNNTTDVSPTAGTLRYETTIPLQDTLGAERFGLSVTDEFRESPIVFTESEEVFVVVSGLTAQEVRGLLVDTALRASV